MMRPLRLPRRFAILLAAPVLAAGGTVLAATGAGDRAAPRVTVTKPVAGSTTLDTTPRLAGAAGHARGDARSVTVKVYAGKRVSGRALRTITVSRTGGRWAVTLTRPLAAGTYTVQAHQRDTAGHRGTSPRATFIIRIRKPVAPPVVSRPPVVVKPTPPVTAPVTTLAISSPAGGSWVRDGHPSFSGTARTGSADSRTVVVRVYAGAAASGSAVQTVEATRSGAAWTSGASGPLPDGVYTARAEQAGAGGAIARSAAVTFTVDTTAPQVSLAAPPGGSSVATPTPTFAGTAGNAPGDSGQVRVEVFRGPVDSGTPVAVISTVRSAAAFSTTAQSNLAVGTYTARAEQSDAAGNTGRGPARTFAVTSSAPVSGYRETVMADAPRAYWRLGEASGATAADQVSAAGAGTYLGGPTLGQAGIVPTAQSTAVTLDGADDAVRVDDSAALDPADALAIETWVKPTSLPTGTASATLARKDLQYLLRLGSGGKVSFRLWRGGAATEITSTGNAVSAGAWSHVVASFDGTSLSIYVNGVKVGSGLAMGASIDSSANPLYLGSSGGYDYLSGRLDEVALYGTALPAARISAHLGQADPVNDAPPTLSLESPGNGSVTDGRPVFSGTAGVAKGDSATVTVRVFAGTGTSGTATQTLTTTRQATIGTYSVAPSSALDPGTYTARAEQTNTNGLTGRSPASTFTVSDGTAPTIAAAGDIADCSGTDDEATADLLDDIPGTVLTLGDNAYTYGSATEFGCFDRSWGRHKARMRPIPGDHDYGQPDATGYFDYFGSAAGPPTGRLLQLQPRQLAHRGAQLGVLRAAPHVQCGRGCVAEERPGAEQLLLHARAAARAPLQLRGDPRQRGQRPAALADPVRPRRRRGAQRQRAHVRALRPPDAHGHGQRGAGDSPVHGGHRGREPLPGRGHQAEQRGP